MSSHTASCRSHSSRNWGSAQQSGIRLKSVTQRLTQHVVIVQTVTGILFTDPWTSASFWMLDLHSSTGPCLDRAAELYNGWSRYVVSYLGALHQHKWHFLMTRSKWQLHVPFPYFSSRIADWSRDQSQYNREMRLRREVSSQTLLCWYCLLLLVHYISHTRGWGSLPCLFPQQLRLQHWAVTKTPWGEGHLWVPLSVVLNHYVHWVASGMVCSYFDRSGRREEWDQKQGQVINLKGQLLVSWLSARFCVPPKQCYHLEWRRLNRWACRGISDWNHHPCVLTTMPWLPRHYVCHLLQFWIKIKVIPLKQLYQAFCRSDEKSHTNRCHRQLLLPTWYNRVTWEQGTWPEGLRRSDCSVTMSAGHFLHC